MLLRNRRQASSQDRFISSWTWTKSDELTAENNNVLGQRCCPEACCPTTTDIISQCCWSVPGQKHELRNWKEERGCCATRSNPFRRIAFSKHIQIITIRMQELNGKLFFFKFQAVVLAEVAIQESKIQTKKNTVWTFIFPDKPAKHL